MLLLVALLPRGLVVQPNAMLWATNLRIGRPLAALPESAEVRWFPPLDLGSSDVEPSGAEGNSVMPLFPLGAAYLPYTSPVLNIFEPR